MSRAKNTKKGPRSRASTRAAQPANKPAELPPEVAALRARALEMGMSGEQGALVSSLLDTVIALTNERAALTSERAALTNGRTALAGELERSELRIKKLLFVAYGHKTERLTRDELMQLVLSFGATEQEARAEEPDVPHAPPPDEPVEDAPPLGPRGARAGAR